MPAGLATSRASQPSGSARLGSWRLSSARSWLARVALRASNKNLHYFKSIKSVAYICAPWGANDSFWMLQKFLRIKVAFDEHEHLVAYIWSFWTIRECICMLRSIKQKWRISILCRPLYHHYNHQELFDLPSCETWNQRFSLYSSVYCRKCIWSNVETSILLCHGLLLFQRTLDAHMTYYNVCKAHV